MRKTLVFDTHNMENHSLSTKYLLRIVLILEDGLRTTFPVSFP